MWCQRQVPQALPAVWKKRYGSSASPPRVPAGAVLGSLKWGVIEREGEGRVFGEEANRVWNQKHGTTRVSSGREPGWRSEGRVNARERQCCFEFLTQGRRPSGGKDQATAMDKVR